jgi:hypothetical protein
MKLVSFMLATSWSREVCAELNALGAADYVLCLAPNSNNLALGGKGETVVICRVPDDFDTSQLPRA